VRARSLDESIDLVNANPFGNGAVIFTASGWAAQEFCRRARAGMIGVNVPIPIPVARYSFGGWKDSRFGDANMAGPEAFRFFTQGQIVTTRWPESEPASDTQLAFGHAGQ
jgi:malonate-semialdehyde dehydrogenase (acetylating)/methylmalonate-semialdehyde dehydrogenase